MQGQGRVLCSELPSMQNCALLAHCAILESMAVFEARVEAC